MLSLNDVPAVQNKVLSSGLCNLDITCLATATNLEEAWNLLPDSGVGVVTLADRLERYNPRNRAGLLLEAEISDGDTTITLRASGPIWHAWRWSEKPGDSHRWVEYRFLSSEPGANPPRQIYRQYWKKDPIGAEQISVWLPTGARFCGFEEDPRA